MSGAVLDQAQEAMEDQERTANAGTLHKSGLPSTKSHIIAELFAEESANRINACKFPVCGPSSELRLCGSGEVSSCTAITYSTIWKGEGQSPPFKVDEPTAVEFISAVLASAVGTRIQHSIALTEAV
eukprot:1587786-Pleurochrysis_carterae.AAC.1